MKRIKAMIVVGAIALLGVGVATPAMAGSNLCGTSKVCIYIDLNYVGPLGQRSGGGALNNVTSGANDKTSSWENKSSYNSRWYTDRDGTGTCRSMKAKSEVGYVGATYNDKLTSWATNGSC